MTDRRITQEMMDLAEKVQKLYPSLKHVPEIEIRRIKELLTTFTSDTVLKVVYREDKKVLGFKVTDCSYDSTMATRKEMTFGIWLNYYNVNNRVIEGEGIQGAEYGVEYYIMKNQKEFMANLIIHIIDGYLLFNSCPEIIWKTDV